jgi:hypothetical protein
VRQSLGPALARYLVEALQPWRQVRVNDVSVFSVLLAKLLDPSHMSANCRPNDELLALENIEALALDTANYYHSLNQQCLLHRREAQDWWLSLCRQSDKGANLSTHLISHGPEIQTDQHFCKLSPDITINQEYFAGSRSHMKK